MSPCQRLQIQRPMSQAPCDPVDHRLNHGGRTTEHCHTERGLEPWRSLPSLRSYVKKKESGYFKPELQVKDAS